MKRVCPTCGAKVSDQNKSGFCNRHRDRTGANNPFFGKKHSQETLDRAREKKKEATKKLWQNEEYRKKVTESNKKFYQEHPDRFKGENNPMYGKKHTQEALDKIKANAATKKQKIAQLDKETLEIIQIFDGIKDAEKFLQVSHGWLSKAARNNKVAYGYRWKFM